MKQLHYVSIEIDTEELISLLHPVLKRRGLLFDIPANADRNIYDLVQVTIEYSWEREVKKK